MGAGQRGRGSCFPAAGAPCLTSWGCPIPAGIRGQVGCGPDLAPVIAVRTPAGSTGSGTDDLRGPFQPSRSVMVVPFYLAAGYPHDPEARRAGRGGAGRRTAALRAPGERDGGCGEEPGRERRPNPPQRLRPPNRSSAPPPGRSAALPGLSERYRPKADAPSCAEPTGRRLSEQLIACSATDSPGRRACEEALAKRLTAIAAASPPETERCGTARRGRPAMRHCGLCWVGLRSPPPPAAAQARQHRPPAPRLCRTTRERAPRPRRRPAPTCRPAAHRPPALPPPSHTCRPASPLALRATPRSRPSRPARRYWPEALPPRYHWSVRTDNGRSARRETDTPPPCARGTLGVVGGASYRPQQGLSQPRTSPSSALGCSARRCRPGAPLRSRRGAAGCSEESKASPQCPVLGFSAGNCTVSVAGVCGRQDLASALTLPHR